MSHFPDELHVVRGFLKRYVCLNSGVFSLLAAQRHLDGVCTHRNFIQAFVSGMLAS